MLNDSPELRKGEGPGYGGLHVRNQVTFNGNKMCVFEEAYVDTLCAV